MKEMPAVKVWEDGNKGWEQVFETFEVRVCVPRSDEITQIVNYGFRAPYFIVFEEKKRSLEEAKQFAEESGLAEIASSYGGSVVSVYPVNAGGWKEAPADLFASLISESRISQYYQDGAALMRDRFTGNWGDYFIRGAVLRTYLYGFGESADYIARNCLKRIEGDGLYGKGDITPVVCSLQGLHVIPEPEARDIPVISVGNSAEINKALQDNLDYVLVKDSADYKEDFKRFTGTFRRMVGHLEKEADLDAMGMVMEPGYCVVATTPDNRGDDKDTAEHKIGYVAYYNKGIMDDGKKAPLVMCFHGGGDSAICMATISGWYQVAAKYDFLLISVENHLNSTASETIAMMEQLKEKYSIDTEKIYATGFSMGGCKSWDMFQEYPAVFAALAPMDATYDVGLNAYGEKAPKMNEDVMVPVFYVGGEETPLPELPFQEVKCLNRMRYVLQVNRAVAKYDVKFEEQDTWANAIWGIDGDVVKKLPDVSRGNSVLTLNLFVSENDCCYCIFGCVSGQGHEVRHHSCENAWKFMNSFRRLPDGTLEGGAWEDMKKLY